MDGCPARPLLGWLARLIEAMQHKDLRLHSLATREAQQTLGLLPQPLESREVLGEEPQSQETPKHQYFMGFPMA